MCYFLDHNGIPAVLSFYCVAFVSIIAAIYYLSAGNCFLVENAAHVSAPSWLLISGSTTVVFGSFFLLQNWYFGREDSCIYCRRILFGIISLFSVTWMIFGIDVIGQFSANKAMNPTSDCVGPGLFMMFLVIPNMLIQFIFFGLLVCCPLSEGSEYTRAMTVEGDYGTF